MCMVRLAIRKINNVFLVLIQNAWSAIACKLLFTNVICYESWACDYNCIIYLFHLHYQELLTADFPLYWMTGCFNLWTLMIRHWRDYMKTWILWALDLVRSYLYYPCSFLLNGLFMYFSFLFFSCCFVSS